MFDIPPRTLRRKASIRRAAEDVIQGGMSVRAAALKHGINEKYLTNVSSTDKWRDFQDNMVNKQMRPALAKVSQHVVMDELVNEQFAIYKREVLVLRERAAAAEKALPHLEGNSLAEVMKTVRLIRLEIEARLGLDIVRRAGGKQQSPEKAPIGTIVDL
jgi:hypothetical protein